MALVEMAGRYVLLRVGNSGRLIELLVSGYQGVIESGVWRPLGDSLRLETGGYWIYASIG
jgi:hypothetical protein